MAEHLFRNWIVYVLLGGFIYFVSRLIIISRKQEKEEQGKSRPQEKK